MTSKTHEYTLQLSPSFEEYEGLSESRDYAQATLALGDGRVFSLHFTTLHRLAQDAEEEIRGDGYYIDENLVIVRDVDRKTMHAVVSHLVENGRFSCFRLAPASTSKSKTLE